MGCGVLALQGDWAAHLQTLRCLGVKAKAVRTAADFDGIEGLVFPGGESTAMLRLLGSEDLDQLGCLIRGGMPVLATCAGVILLAKRVTPEQESLELLDVEVERNAYGRQLASVVLPLSLTPEMGLPAEMEGVFIRAPRIVHLGHEVRVLARRGDDPVLVRQDRIIAATFHPELSKDQRVHQLFLGLFR